MYAPRCIFSIELILVTTSSYDTSSRCLLEGVFFFFFLLTITNYSLFISRYLSIYLVCETGGCLNQLFLKILFLVEGRSVFHKWRCSLWRNYTL